MRAMLLEFPDDPTCDYLDRQYMLGSSLLVAPVFSSEGDVTYYLPAGRWTHFLTGRVIEGPGWVRERHGFLSLPLMVRPDSVIPVGGCENRPDYDYGDGVTLQAYELTDGGEAVAVIPSPTGQVEATFRTSREGNLLTAEWQGATKRWQLLLAGIATVAAVEGGTAESSPQGVLIRPAENVERLRILLAG